MVKDIKTRPRPDQGPEERSVSRTIFNAYPAVVEELIGKTGTRGEGMQVRCRILEGPDRNKILRRNVKGPVRLKDVLMLRETEIEARKLNTGSSRNSSG